MSVQSPLSGYRRKNKFMTKQNYAFFHMLKKKEVKLGPTEVSVSIQLKTAASAAKISPENRGDRNYDRPASRL